MSISGTIRGAVGALIRPLSRHFQANFEARLLPFRNRLDQVETHSRALETRSQVHDTRTQALETHARALETRAQALDARTQALDTRAQALETRSQALDARSEALETRCQTLETGLRDLDEGFRQHLPAFLNAVSTVGAFGHELARHRDEAWKAIANVETTLQGGTSAHAAFIDQHGRSIRELWARLEFVRRELMYEMKFGSVGSATAAGPQSAQILNAEKLADARRTGRLRINIGCGHVPLDGYLNLDKRNLPGVDIVADASNLPFEPQTVVEIFSAHVLEHFPEEQLRRALLPHWYAVLAPRGMFRAIVPDGEAMLAHSAAGEYPFEDFREVLFGGQEYDGDYHFNLFTPASLRKLLMEAGFCNIEIPVQGRRNGRCYEFEITAERQSPAA